jgi:large conductance mechanosensitive channel
MLREFREFIDRGNLVDIAVGFVLGVAFATVVSSLTDRVVSPLIGLIFNVDGLENLWTFANGEGSVGAFLAAVINFLIIAFVIFLVVRAYNRLKRVEAPAEPAGPTEDVLLLREIRDALRRDA